jgi:nucleotide-binding universal stress UspA family protein
MTTSHLGKIAVGVDGSECAKRALAWAIAEAKLRGAEVVAVHAYQVPVVVPAPGGFAYTIPDLDFEAEARQSLDNAIKEVAGGADDVHIERRVVQRGAPEALIRASDAADLLVVGSRGLGGFKGLLLGSVSHQCAHHAHCPVVIIPHDEG